MANYESNIKNNAMIETSGTKFVLKYRFFKKRCFPVSVARIGAVNV